MTEVKKALTIEKAAAILGTSPAGLRSRVRRGQVKPLRGSGGQGRPVLFDPAEVARLAVQARPDPARLARFIHAALADGFGPSVVEYYKPAPSGFRLFMRDNRGRVVARSYSDRAQALEAGLPPLAQVPAPILETARKLCARLDVQEVEYIQALLFASHRLPPEKPFDNKTQETLDEALGKLRIDLLNRPDLFRLFNETLYSFDARAVRYLLDGHLEKYLPPEKLPKENFKPLMPDLDEEKAAKYSVALVRWARRGQNRYRSFFSSAKRGIESNRKRKLDKIPCREIADLLGVSHMTTYRIGQRPSVRAALGSIARLVGVRSQVRRSGPEIEPCPFCGAPDTGADKCPACGSNLESWRIETLLADSIGQIERAGKRRSVAPRPDTD